MKQFLKKHSVWFIPLFLIILLISVQAYYRDTPSRLPITDQWAKQVVEGQAKQQLLSDVNVQFPNLPDDVKNKEVEKRFASQKNNLSSDEAMVSKNFKAQLQDENGITYPLDIDSYLWMMGAKNYLKCGHNGCDNRSDGVYYDYRNGRLGFSNPAPPISILEAWISKYGHLPLHRAVNLTPIIFMGLAIIPAFFICRKLTGNNVGGFFGALIISLGTQLMTRITPDNDWSNIIFPLFILWFFFLAYTSEAMWKKLSYSVLGAITFWLFYGFWDTEHIFLVLTITIVLMTIIHIIRKESWKNYIGGWTFMGFSALILSTLTTNYNYLWDVFGGLLKFATIKEVAVNSLYPRVFATVAEFNEAPLSQLIPTLGGWLFISFAIIGIILLIKKVYDDDDHKNYVYAISLVLFVCATAYSYTKGMRFALLIMPFFAIAFGCGIGLLYKFLIDMNNKSTTHKMNDLLLKSMFIVIAFLLFVPTLMVQAQAISMQQIPYFNDAFVDTYNAIKSDANDGIGLVSGWWDYFYYATYSDVRAVTDGGNNGDIAIFWTGLAYTTNNEKLAVGIFRMLDCYQVNASIEMDKYFDTTKSVDIIKEIIQLNRTEAKKILILNGLSEDESKEILDMTHCDKSNYLDYYLITDDSNIGKSGVINHFGSWNFTKAEQWNLIYHSKDFDSIKDNLTTRYNLSLKDASKLYSDAKTTDAHTFISTYMGIIPQKLVCSVENNITYNCGQGIVKIDLQTLNGTIYMQNQKMPVGRISFWNINQEVSVKDNDLKSPLGVALLSDGTAYVMDAKLVDSILSRVLFYGSSGLNRYKVLSTVTQINSERIIVDKIDISEYDK